MFIQSWSENCYQNNVGAQTTQDSHEDKQERDKLAQSSFTT